jgi:hypothetical protein
MLKKNHFTTTIIGPVKAVRKFPLIELLKLVKFTPNKISKFVGTVYKIGEISSVALKKDCHFWKIPLKDGFYVIKYY